MKTDCLKGRYHSRETSESELHATIFKIGFTKRTDSARHIKMGSLGRDKEGDQKSCSIFGPQSFCFSIFFEMMV